MPLLVCPFCGSDAEHGTIDEGQDSGGHFIQCTNTACGASTCLRFASGDDPTPLLIEQWNRRSGSLHTYEVTAEALTQNKKLAAALEHERANVDRLLGLIDEMLDNLPPNMPPQRGYYNEVTAIISNDRQKVQAN